VEHIEVFIKIIVVDQLNGNVVFAVRKRTKMAIIALFEVVGIVGTELSFVFLGSIELLDSIMSLYTGIGTWAHYDFLIRELA
jgi:hypothetical protein